jgi:hypothetical protein
VSASSIRYARPSLSPSARCLPKHGPTREQDAKHDVSDGAASVSALHNHHRAPSPARCMFAKDQSLKAMPEFVIFFVIGSNSAA